MLYAIRSCFLDSIIFLQLGRWMLIGFRKKFVRVVVIIFNIYVLRNLFQLLWIVHTIDICACVTLWIMRNFFLDMLFVWILCVFSSFNLFFFESFFLICFVCCFCTLGILCRCFVVLFLTCAYYRLRLIFTSLLSFLHEELY